MEVKEQVTAVGDFPRELWDDIPARDTAWASLRSKAAGIAAERPGWALDPHGRETEVHGVYYMRFVASGDGDELMAVECAPEEAEFVRLRLACWAEKR